MKKLIILLFVFMSKLGYGQYYEDYDKSHNYQLTVPTFFKNFDDNKDVLIPEKTRFTVIGDFNQDNIIVIIGLFDSKKDEFEKLNLKNSQKKPNKEYDISIENRKLFILSKKSLSSNAITVFPNIGENGSWNWAAGLVVLPIKLRNMPKEQRTFSKDLSLGFSGGGKVRLSKYNPTYLNFLVNVGISAITVDKNTTNGKLTTNSERAAMTGAFGVVFENHAYQFGLFFGKDRLTAQDQKETDWQFKNKPWIALGLGYSILSKSDKSKNQGPATN
jgi:hypothetical protein